MDAQKSEEYLATIAKSTVSSNIRQARQRMARNYLLLWVDTSIDQTNEEYENILKQIQAITGDVNVFTQHDACIDFLTDAQEDIKSFLIVKDTMSQQIMPLINDIPQLHGVYIFIDTEILHEDWIKNWRKIKSVHTNVSDLCQALQINIRRSNQDSIPMSFITANEMASTTNLDQLEPTFMYTQIFKDILLDMEHGKQAIKHFTAYCRNNNSLSPINIDRFEKEYHAQLAIWWYTFPSNIFPVLNYALRTMDAEVIITMGFFLRDVHEQIQQLYEQQVNSYDGKSFKVYRGQGLMKSDFEKLQKTKGGLLSFNNFLSTSKNEAVSLGFAHAALTEPNKVGILLIISIDPFVKSTPFASIEEQSYYEGQEEEILFSMHTVFRVGAIEHMSIENQLYQVELQLTTDDDQQLRLLTDRIREEVRGVTGWQKLGSLLLKIGQFNKAEELYSVLLEQTSDEGERALYYNQLGCAKDDQSDYEKATWYYEQALEILEKTLPSNHPDLATSYNNIGSAYDHIGEYSKALSYYEKAHKIKQKTLPSNHSSMATLYNNLGLMYNNTAEYSKALSYYEKALEIRQETLHTNHPDFAQSYNNIGIAYENMGEYSKALSSHKKSLEIRQKALPSNHPDLATSYNNVGSACDHMGEYSKALLYYEKALEIKQKTLHSDHSSLATSYNNIGSVYDHIGEYSKALSFHEKALEIYKKTLASNHPLLAISKDNIGLVYNHMGEYSKALSFHEEALEIRQKMLPLNQPSLGTSYNNIGSVYNHMGEYSTALSFHEKALEIRQKALPSSHPSLATSYNGIGIVHDNIGEYSKALYFYGKALEIRENALPSNHPDLATSYSNIAKVFNNMKDYAKALSYYERALDIWQRGLARAHPDIKSVQEGIEILKEILKND
ncbi:unnamed protein product [Adineta steineri]|uniref:Uncharacterized protein n=1 Tax=Adineta steineri TaxID=433720 RepID=A0A814J986_9BILA|nr:unnamed protein product [Adineta steineri]CAF3948818.1 unnamed protein product [Adineta steineri]